MVVGRVQWLRQRDAQTTGRYEDALAILQAALDAVDPVQAVRRVLRREGEVLHVDGRTYDLRRFRRVWVVGAGKAGAAMAQAAEQVLGERVSGGWVNVKYGYTAPTARVTVHEAGHPLPDEAGVQGAQRIAEIVRGAGADDLVLCLISGGGSALMTLPVEGVSLQDLQQITDALLRSGAPIEALNAVRKHLSQLKGGQLARLAYPATVITLILSDVVGNPLDVIASGPTVPDPTTFAEARAILARYGLWDAAPSAVRRHIERGLVGDVPETPKAGDPTLAQVHNVIVADNAHAAESALHEAQARAFHALLLSTYVEGEAREVAKVLVALGREVLAHGRPISAPACLIFGGETTVTVRGGGRGGRNQELALAAALALEDVPRVALASLATDGTDGPTDAAGALVDGQTAVRGRALGLDAEAALTQNDAYTYLRAVGDQLVTGPTNTNVNDLMCVFVW